MGKCIDGRRLRRGLPLLLACLIAASAVVMLASCGGSGDADSGSTTSTVASRARRVVRVAHVKQDRWTYARARFNEICAGCHTLADAGATGRRFNLDHGRAVDETHVRSTIAEGEPGMPRFRDVLSEREFEELVAYISTVARRTPGDDYWHDQLSLRSEGTYWSAADTRRLEAFARRLALRR
jgi:mono/diheme cytochrome c family protein